MEGRFPRLVAGITGLMALVDIAHPFPFRQVFFTPGNNSLHGIVPLLQRECRPVRPPTQLQRALEAAVYLGRHAVNQLLIIHGGFPVAGSLIITALLSACRQSGVKADRMPLPVAHRIEGHPGGLHWR